MAGGTLKPPPAAPPTPPTAPGASTDAVNGDEEDDGSFYSDELEDESYYDDEGTELPMPAAPDQAGSRATTGSSMYGPA